MLVPLHRLDRRSHHALHCVELHIRSALKLLEVLAELCAKRREHDLKRARCPNRLRRYRGARVMFVVSLTRLLLHALSGSPVGPYLAGCAVPAPSECHGWGSCLPVLRLQLTLQIPSVALPRAPLLLIGRRAEQRKLCTWSVRFVLRPALSSTSVFAVTSATP